VGFFKNKETEEKETVTKEEVYNSVIDAIVMQDSSFLSKSLNSPQGLERLEGKINQVINSKRIEGIEAEEVVDYLTYLMSGYSVLTDLIEDEEISDIKAYTYDHIRIKRLGRREGTDVKFKSAKDFDRFVNILAIRNQIPLSDLNAVQTFTDKDASDNYILRLNITTNLINSSDSPFLQIRKIPKFKYSADELIKAGMFDKDVAAYLLNAARKSDGMVFSGKGASGKTTLMNLLIDFIPHDKSALVIQENEELFSTDHPDIMFQHIVTSRGEGRIEYTLEDLARNGLLIDLDYFIIGEIKGREAAHIMMASFTGHQAWTSVHGKSAKDAMYKLADYVKQATDYSLTDSLMMLSGMQTIVFMKNFKVYEIAEYSGVRNGELMVKPVFTYNEDTKTWKHWTDEDVMLEEKKKAAMFGNNMFMPVPSSGEINRPAPVRDNSLDTAGMSTANGTAGTAAGDTAPAGISGDARNPINGDNGMPEKTCGTAGAPQEEENTGVTETVSVTGSGEAPVETAGDGAGGTGAGENGLRPGLHENMTRTEKHGGECAGTGSVPEKHGKKSRHRPWKPAMRSV